MGRPGRRGIRRLRAGRLAHACLTTAGVSSSTERGMRSLARTVPDSAGSQSNSPALASRLRRCSAGSGTGTAATSRWVYSVCGLRRI